MGTLQDREPCTKGTDKNTLATEEPMYFTLMRGVDRILLSSNQYLERSEGTGMQISKD